MDSVVLACYDKKCSKFQQKINQQSHIYDFSRFRKHAKKGQCISYNISFYFNPSFSAKCFKTVSKLLYCQQKAINRARIQFGDHSQGQLCFI